ncbi:MAG: cyclodeaminase/cyclohydrolase family protein, partial [Myxococcota bacterium]
ASAAPTPGGGSVAALAGAFGAGLVAMAVDVTEARRKDGALDAEREALAALIAGLRAAADEDREVFEAFMEALRLPKATGEERRRREAAKVQAARRATEAPLAAAARMRDALALAETLRARVRKSVVSDVDAGADLLRGAVHAALRNVDINLPALPEGERAGPAAERAALAEEAERLARG